MRNIITLFVALVSAFTSNLVLAEQLDHSKNTVNLNLVANWQNPSFKLQLLETAASLNESIYIEALAQVLQLSLSENSDDVEDEYDEDNIDSLLTEKQYYDKVFQVVKASNEESYGFFDIYLANNYYAPRIVSHFKYYNSSVLPQFSTKLSNCFSTFDSPDEDQKEGLPTTWILYNGETLCNPDDIFALKTSGSSSKKQNNDALLPFDRVIGTNNDAPLVILYGDINDPKLPKYVFHLFQSAKAGKLRFVWRYIPPTDDGSRQLLGGYGVDLTLKRTDYIVIDDRDIKNSAKVKNLDGKENEQAVLDSADAGLEEFSSGGWGFLNKTYKNIKGLSKRQLKSLDLKVAYSLLSYEGDAFEKFELLKQVVGGFPKFSYDIAKNFKISKKNPDFQDFLKNVKSNSRLGANEEIKGIYVNGKQLSDYKLNLFGLLKLIKQESSYVELLRQVLGITTLNAKKFISEFARLSAAASLRSSGSGNRRRYDVRSAIKDEKISGEKVVFLNDLENDPEYEHFTTDRRVWLSEDLVPGKLPEYKENILEVVFAINLANKKLMNVAAQITHMVLARGIAHRVGILPIVLKEDNPYYLQFFEGEVIRIDGEKRTLDVKELIILDRLLQTDFYTRSKSSSFDFLRYAQSLNPTYFGDLWKRYEKRPSLIEKYDNSEFLERFSIDEGYLIVNGVFEPFNIFHDSWRMFLGQQILQDVELIHRFAQAGKIPLDGAQDSKSVADRFYSDLEPVRNTLILPQDQSDIKYISVTKDLLQEFSGNDNVLTLVNNGGTEREKRIYTHTSLSLVGDYNAESIRKQLIEIFKNEKALLKEDSKVYLTKFRFVNTASDNLVIEKLRKIFHTKESPLIQKLNDAINYLDNIKGKATFSSSVNESITKALSLANINIKQFPAIILNSRVIEIPEGKTLQAEVVRYLFTHELKNRLFDFLFQVVNEFEENYFYVSSTPFDRFDWVDIFFSTLTQTATYSAIDDAFGIEFPRYQMELLHYNHTSFTLSADLENTKEKALVDIVVIIDPISESAQKIVYLVDALSKLAKTTNSVHITILFAPTISLTELPVKRFYSGLFLPEIKFDENTGAIDKSIYDVEFGNVPQETLFTLDLDVPHAWIVLAKESEYDLDNIKLDLTEEGYIKGVYELNNLIIEGYTDVEDSLEPPYGVQLELKDAANVYNSGHIYADTNIMANYGYFQLKSNPGLWELSIKPNTKSSEIYSFSRQGSNNNKIGTVIQKDGNLLLSVLDLDGLVLVKDFVKNPGKENEALLLKDDEDLEDVEAAANKKAGGGFLSSLWSKSGKNEVIKKKQADINIFAVASGHLYERLLSIMIASVRNHTEHTLKFWLIDNYMSANFKKFLPTLAAKYNFEYELITYKWPVWLRDQREKQRTIWGYKILFLDVLFPQDLDKVIFVDADQIVRTDLKELIDVDLQGAPYGYTPMCDSRKEMEGFRFWKQGYWKTLLSRGNKPYHISALYVVDLKKFRAIAAGDRLRQHYQQLSADPNSLSNLDQDLPNNMQYSLKIHSLDQDWLWCETWCSDDALKTAKTIDLCNNPLTKEPKLDRARRQIPEWTEYDNEIGKLIDEFKSDNEDVVIKEAVEKVKKVEDSEAAEHAELFEDTEVIEEEDPLHDEL